MTTLNTTIFLGDLLRAFEQLAPGDDATRSEIAGLLGLYWNSEPALPAAGPREQPGSAGQPPLPEPTLVEQATPILPTVDVELAPATTATISSTINQLDSAALRWTLSEIEPLEQQIPEDSIEPPRHEPLFVPNWTRAILSGSLATLSEDGLLDVQRIVEAIGRGKVVQRVYKHPWKTLRRGVQLLVDTSEALMPYYRDQSWLQEEVLRVVGADRVEMLRFVGCPIRGAGTGPISTWTAYQPPLPGTVVVLLTDLGIGQPMFATDQADVSQWVKFIEAVDHNDCPLIAFVPYAPSHWPAELQSLITIVQWDRTTTAGTVRNLVGQGHEVMV